MVIVPDPPPCTIDDVLDWYLDEKARIDAWEASQTEEGGISLLTMYDRRFLVNKRDELLVLCRLTAEVI